MNIKQNPTPNTISIPMDVKESARHIIRIQYIKVKYNSIPLIISENIFIAFSDFITPLYIFNILRSKDTTYQNFMRITTIYL